MSGQTTIASAGNASYCTADGRCSPCTKDADCVPHCGPQAACIVCVGEFGCDEGTACVGPEFGSCDTV